MSDNEPFYAPGRKPTPQPRYRPESTEPLWELRTDHVTWSAELRFHGESWGWEAQIYRDGEITIGRRFDTKALAVQWAALERADIENGGGL
jgi:hypothetical protein